MRTFTYRQPELCSTTTPADCVAPLGACIRDAQAYEQSFGRHSLR